MRKANRFRRVPFLHLAYFLMCVSGVHPQIRSLSRQMLPRVYLWRPRAATNGGIRSLWKGASLCVVPRGFFAYFCISVRYSLLPSHTRSRKSIGGQPWFSRPLNRQNAIDMMVQHCINFEKTKDLPLSERNSHANFARAMYMEANREPDPETSGRPKHLETVKRRYREFVQICGRDAGVFRMHLESNWAMGRKKLLSWAQERQLVRGVLDDAHHGVSCSMDDMAEMTHAVLLDAGRRDASHPPPCMNTIRRMARDHREDIVARRSTVMSAVRAAASVTSVFVQHFVGLAEAFATLGLTPEEGGRRCINMDETGSAGYASKNTKSRKKYFFPRAGGPCDGRIALNGGRTPAAPHITFATFISHNGQVGRVHVILTGSNEAVADEVPRIAEEAGWNYRTSKFYTHESGSMTLKLFNEVIREFVADVERWRVDNNLPSDYVLILLFDGVACHDESRELIEFLMQHHIYVLFLTPNATHLYQPLVRTGRLSLPCSSLTRRRMSTSLGFSRTKSAQASRCCGSASGHSRTTGSFATRVSHRRG